jgi:hypothetical protein
MALTHRIPSGRRGDDQTVFACPSRFSLAFSAPFCVCCVRCAFGLSGLCTCCSSSQIARTGPEFVFGDWFLLQRVGALCFLLVIQRPDVLLVIQRTERTMASKAGAGAGVKGIDSCCEQTKPVKRTKGSGAAGAASSTTESKAGKPVTKASSGGKPERPDELKLLARDEFNAACFQRDNYKCVVEK